MTLLAVVKVTLVFATAYLALVCLRRQSAALRHTVIVAVLLAAAAVPVLELTLPEWRILPGSAAPAADTSTDYSNTRSTTAVPLADTALRETFAWPPEPIRGSASSSVTSVDWLVTGWAVGVLALLLLFAARLIAMRTVVRNSRALNDERWQRLLDETQSGLRISAPVRLRVRSTCTTPAVWGVSRPLVLLPAECLNWPTARCRAVLAHELAHVARHDVLTLWLGHLVCALYWFHPLAWRLKHRLALESERACDDLAVAQGTTATRYADVLLSTAADLRHPYRIVPVMAARSQLEERIMAILDTDKTRGRAGIRARLVVATVATAALVPLSSLSWAQPTADTAVADSVTQIDSDSVDFAAYLHDAGIDKTDVAALLDGLNAADALGRAASAWALGSSDDPRVVEPLIQAGYDADATVRQCVVRSLADWQERRVTQLLVDRLQDSDAEVREWAVRSLDDHPVTVQVQPLIDMLGDNNPDVREWTVRVLADLDEPGVHQAFADRLAVESNPDVSEWLIRSADGEGDESVDALINGTYNESAEVRQWAVRGLGGRDSDRAIDAMINLLKDDDDEVREWSVRGLGNCGNDRAVAPLQAMTQDPNPDVREWVDHSLRKIRC